MVLQDIDNYEVEHAILDAIRDDPNALALIDEVCIRCSAGMVHHAHSCCKKRCLAPFMHLPRSAQDRLALVQVTPRWPVDHSKPCLILSYSSWHIPVGF